MGDIIDIKELRKKAITTIEIPGFEGIPTIKVKVQKPRIMIMAAQGKIPNPLMGLATKMVQGKISPNKLSLEEGAKMMELYCRACMVEPTYEQMKDIITDEQMLVIFNWAVGDTQKMANFRKNQEDGTDNRDGEDVPEKAERDTGD
jgi:hypothetical protein